MAALHAARAKGSSAQAQMNSIRNSRRMVVVQQRPGLSALLWFAGALVIAGASYAGWRLGHMDGGGIAVATHESLQDAHAALQKRTVAVERQLADNELGQVIDVDTTEQLRQTIKEMGDQRAEIEEEVRFYRQLMAPSEAQRGLRVEKLDLIASGERGEGETVEYRLLLTQVVDRHDFIRGEVNLDVIGSAQGAQQVLSLTDLSQPEAYPLEFRFRYFQDFAGKLELPADFEAERVVVTAVSSGRRGKQIQRTFSWNLQRG